MKGILFTELIEMIEDLMGLEFANKVIDDARLKNAGAYTAIGSYPYQDMFKLMESLSKHAESPQDKILKGYGECLFHRLSKSYQKELGENADTFSFLLQLENLLKQEIRKLHPKAEIPSFKARLLNSHSMEIHYSSIQKMGALEMGALVEGFIIGCIGHFNEPIDMQREDLPTLGSNICFFLQKRAANE